MVTVPHAQLEPNRCKVAIGYSNSRSLAGTSESESATLRTSCIPSLQAKMPESFAHGRHMQLLSGKLIEIMNIHVSVGSDPRPEPYKLL